MIIIPAIDILDSKCVRLYQGSYSDVTIYSQNPVEIVKSYEQAGATRIHIVDLDGAKGQGKNNRHIIKKMREAVACTLELGGGIRSKEDIKELTALGIDHLILGTVFAKHPEKVKEWIDTYDAHFIAGIDALNGKVKITGWETDSGVDDIALAKKAKEIGLKEIIYTNISNDGALTGPDIERTIMIAEQSAMPVILSGGISKKEDIAKVVQAQCPLIIGIIIGKAIYEQKVSVPDLISSFQNT